MKKLFLGALLISSISFGAQLEDVKILNVVPKQNSFELTLQTKDGPKDSYFLVDISKNDPDSFEKLAQVIKKLVQKDKYKLNLDVISFSDSPSGSYYQSDRVTFYETVDRLPNSLKKKKK